MKSFVLLLVIGTTSAFANDTIRQGLQVLQNPTAAVNSADCDPNDPNAAPWCKDLYKHVCSIKKSSNRLGALDRSINDRYWKNINPSSDKRLVNTTAINAISAAEREVFGQSQVKRPEVVQVFMDAKSVIMQAVTSNPALSKAKQTEMQRKIQSVNLRTGIEYINDLEEWARKQDPGMSADDRRKGAIEMYASTCGANGLEVNAFYEDGSIVLCPGLVFSLEDYNPKTKTEILNALSFTLGHELGHSIDAGEQPEMYTKLASCYQEVSGSAAVWSKDSAGEITGDFWGAQVLAARLRDSGVRGANSARTIALAMDGFCSETSGRNQPHPTGQFRVNMTLARTPAIKESLGCGSPTVDAPACTIAGAYPKPRSNRR